MGEVWCEGRGVARVRGVVHMVSKKGGEGLERGIGLGHEFYTSCKDQLVVCEEADVVWLEVA